MNKSHVIIGSIVCILILVGGYLMMNTSMNLPANPKRFDELTSIRYEYQDSSVPPEYHRSYEVNISDSGKGLVKITNYTDVLYESEFTVTKEQFNQLKTKLIIYDIKQKNQDNSKKQIACTGGTIKRLTLITSNAEHTNLIYSACGDTNTGTGEGDIEVFAQDIKSIVPDFERHLKQTLE